MSLPPGFLDELRTRVSLSQVVGRKVMWDMRKSQQGKGDMWSPCPFHQEKTASFHVDDRKGFYYCFGCHAKGDAITFVIETENVPFIEAVKILADEAGMQMPERDPQAQQKADRRTQLSDVMEEAVKFYRLQLQTGAGAEARRYLDGRGLDAEAQARWELGFAPDDWRRLGAHLREKGIAPDLIAAAGLEKTSSKGGEPYDVFRNRIMFPIRDARGRAIAFGGRAMDPNDNAKYLNSPETELFDKGRQLYNIGNARSAAGRDAQLIVAEGYMDVIALAEAGFAATVAPLGTAITEEQLRLMWRIHPEPVIALDGDTAGQRAALRAMDLALPLLEAGQSLRFCLMPEGQDPDDLLKAKGAGAMQALLAQARPMVDLLWQRETEGKALDSPERRAALDKALRAALERIKDGSIRSHYAEAIKERRYQLFHPRKPWVPRGKARPLDGSRASTRGSELATGAAGAGVLHETVMLALLLRHPRMIEVFEPALARAECEDPRNAALLRAMLTTEPADPDAWSEQLESLCGAEALEKLRTARHLDVVPALRSDDPDMARDCLAETLSKLAARRGAAREIQEALDDISAVQDEALTWRLAQAAAALDQSDKAQNEDKGRFELAPNGVQLDRDERDHFKALLDSMGFSDGQDGKGGAGSG
ncbi:DNA primase [Rhodobacteraceae bacterium THAF1]|uniref:DNA primase n=1 Tax=Palleronia sp. THAF1 TaxID=2587842 RepID=UPI000F41501D|nr:DNA primase [Palleronia sp. THAF1]QFU07994.1 DNA primase [Palleronia sp. THAF1]VDC27845.1 DNA primase [Rhodobacteraceae bacterium THAF1]